MTRVIPGRRQCRGFSLMELMVAMTIGLIILGTLATIFVNTSNTQKEVEQSAQQIENGRYAIDLLTDDVHHAGFFGYYAPPTTTTLTALPDPCDITVAGIKAALAFPIQGYDGPVGTLPSCIASTNYQSGTDILVIRRVSTVATAAASLTGNLVYLQSNGNPTDAANPVVDLGSNLASYSLTVRNGSGAYVAAPINQVVTHIYYVAPCSVPTGSSGTTCQSTDDGGTPVPTLKRIELSVSSGGATSMVDTPLAEGIENLQFDYGIDTAGDGTASATFLTVPAAVADWQKVMALKIHVLARNPLKSRGYTDSKTYSLGTAGTFTPAAPANQYRRHIYTTSARVKNPSERLEIP